MHWVLISLAANCDAKKNLSEARQRLGQVLSSVSFTEELWTEPIGARRPDLYLNQLATGMTTLDTDSLNLWLKDTELQMGRTPQDREQGLVRIDLDLLQYDHQRHHLRDWQRDYVTQLLTQVQFPMALRPCFPMLN